MLIDSFHGFWNRMAMQLTFRTNSPSTGITGKLFTSLFGLVFGSMGLFFMVMMISGIRQSMQLKSWLPTDCVIETAEVRDNGEDYRFTVQYCYEYEGKSYIGSRYKTGDDYRFDDVATKQTLLSTYAPGTHVRCYVNPKEPSRATLERNTSMLPGLGTVLFASIFVMIGYGMIIFTWWPRRQPVAKDERAVTDSTGGRRIGFIFCSIFILIGLIVPYFSFIKPLWRQVDARRWTPLEAVVLKSMVKSHPGDDSTTYSVYIAYRYTLDGRAYEGDRYRFTGGSSSGYQAKAAVVQQHPAGSPLTVYVDPADPTESVVLRNAGASLYLGLIPIVFAVFGFFFLFLLSRGAAPGAVPRSAIGRKAGRSNRTLNLRAPAARRAGTRIGQFIGMIFMALFWNGIVSVFLVETVKEWQSGRHPIFNTLFLTPFVLIGMGLIGGVFYTFLKLFNPVAELDPITDSLSPGTSSLVHFRIRGSVRKISYLTITLTGREEARYSRGTSTYTDRHVFVEQRLLNTPDPRRIESGDITVTIPNGTMHSFSAANNKIIWSLNFKGVIAHWPDVADEFILNVIPKEERI